MKHISYLVLATLPLLAACDSQPEDTASDFDLAEVLSEPASEPVDEGMADIDTPPRVETTVYGTDGSAIGTASLEPVEEGVRLDLHVEGLSPGTHALHFHQHGVCDPPDFRSAGGHFDPAGARHGMPDMDADLSDPDHHAGDMPNQEADDLGTISATIINRSVTLTGPNALLDEDGSALIIHANPDDYESQPAGNAGPRIACAPIAEAENG